MLWVNEINVISVTEITSAFLQYIDSRVLCALRVFQLSSDMYGQTFQMKQTAIGQCQYF